MNIIHGDCLEELKKLEDNSIDAVVCDPPYGLSNTKPQQVADVLKAWVTGDTEAAPTTKGGFMNASWDSFVPPPAVWEECMRVLKPGGHMAVFAGARTQDLMGLSIRLAGFEIRDTLGWVYGSGMPKSLDVSKAIDKKRDDLEPVRIICRYLRAAMELKGMKSRDLAPDFNCHPRLVDHWAARDTDSQPALPKWEQWLRLKELLDLPDDMDAEVWRLNGRKGTPGESWEKREVVGSREVPQGHAFAGSTYGGDSSNKSVNVTSSHSDAAKRWDGWGTALKPAIEPIILARKPLEGTVASNVLAHGVGGLNIDACRVQPLTGAEVARSGKSTNGGIYGKYESVDWRSEAKPHPGRFPANVLLDEHAAKEMDKQSGVSTSVRASRTNGKTGTAAYGDYGAVPGNDDGYDDSGGASRFFPVFKSEEATPEPKGRFPANVLLDEYAAEEMDEQSGITKDGTHVGRNRSSGDKAGGYDGGWKKDTRDIGYSGEGGASRFFPVFKYQAKAPKKERPVIEREDGTKIQHNTVKPLALMEWLVSLIVPPGGVVLDPFAGSGTTLQAAINKGFQPIGIEQDADYIKLIEKRLEGLCTTRKN